MRVLVVFAHPVETSFHAALHRATLRGLAKAGHEIDDLDLYAENFNPVLSRAERLGYHEIPSNRAPVEAYVRRLEAAEAIVFCFPTWSFGPPAILKGFIDRVFLPGVSFELTAEGKAVSRLHTITKVAAVVTYGRPRWTAFMIGDPPRKMITRYMRVLVKPGAPIRYNALYDMNRATQADREAFLAKVERRMAAF